MPELPIALAALMMARICDPHDPYTPHPINPDRLKQWAGRIRVWTWRYPSELHPTRQPDGLHYDLDELVAVARRVGLTNDDPPCNVQVGVVPLCPKRGGAVR